jgi:hypothetical protein
LIAGLGPRCFEGAKFAEVAEQMRETAAFEGLAKEITVRRHSQYATPQPRRFKIRRTRGLSERGLDESVVDF